MSRVKKGVAAKKHKKYLLRRAKGYLNGANSKFRLAKERLLKADSNAYKSRKLRKRDFRKLWIARINGALDQLGSEFSYSKFMSLLKKNNIELNRKSLAEIAVRDINAFKELTDGIVSGKIKGNTKKEEVKNQVSRPSTIKKSKTSKVKTTKKEDLKSADKKMSTELKKVKKTVKSEKTKSSEDK